MFKKIRGRLLLIGLLGAIWWWIRRPQDEAGRASPAEIHVETAEIPMPEIDQPVEPAVQAAPAPRRKKTAVKADDLTVIAGIGPKISGVLKEAGITRYAQLAQADPAQLWEILEAAGIRRLAKPETWIEQAQTLIEA